MTAARRGDLGQRIFYRVVHALILTPFKAIFWVRVRGREKVPRDGSVRGGAVAPLAHGHLLHRRTSLGGASGSWPSRSCSRSRSSPGCSPHWEASRSNVEAPTAPRCVPHRQRSKAASRWRSSRRARGGTVARSSSSSTAAPTSRPGSASRSCPSGSGGASRSSPPARRCRGCTRWRSSSVIPSSRPITAPGASGVRRSPNVTEKVRVELQTCFDEALALAGVPYDPPAPPSAGEVGEHQ